MHAPWFTLIPLGGLYPVVAQKLCPVSTGVVMLHTTRQWCCYTLWNFVWLTRRIPLVEQELLTLPEHLSSSPVFSGARVTRSLVLCVIFCRSLFLLLSYFFWSLCGMSFFDLRILMTPLVSSNSFCSSLWIFK